MDRIIDDAVRKPSGEKDGETAPFPFRTGNGWEKARGTALPGTTGSEARGNALALIFFQRERP
jgi:hypothetical protein